MSFSSFELHPKLLRAVESLGFTQPTPIQTKAIPPLMEGRDVLAAAATGSGKTAAFLLPILHHLMDKKRGKTRALVLTPTRELAAQIAEHLADLARYTNLKGAAVYGGVGMEPQIRAFKNGVDVVIATPGRLLDHFQYPYARLDSLDFLVLDEADRMLDMGFLPDVRKIIAAVSKQRRTLLFSATLPLPIVELAKDMLDRPVALNVEGRSKPAEGISHTVFPVAQELKSHLLLEILKRPDATSVLAFTRTKHRANRLADFLEKRGVSCGRIHGSRSQAQRTHALASFKKHLFPILVATDVAARGIDVEGISLVVNFDVPNLAEDYIHRVGRTARANATGGALTFVSPQEEGDVRRIEGYMGKRIPREKVEGFDYRKRSSERFEIPIGERIAAIRARKAEERARSRAKAEARAKREASGESRPAPKQAPAVAGSSSRRNPRKRGDSHSASGSPPWAGGENKPAAAKHGGGSRNSQGKTWPRKNRRPGGRTTDSAPSVAPRENVPGKVADGNRAGVTQNAQGVREDVFRTHKQEIGGLSSWGRTWREKAAAEKSPEGPRE